MVYKWRKWVFLPDPDDPGYPETEGMMFDRLVEEGYTRITFYRYKEYGYYRLIAYCK
jgi:hypothetical protein